MAKKNGLAGDPATKSKAAQTKTAESKTAVGSSAPGSAGKGNILKWVLIGLGAACAILVIFLLVLDSSGSKYRSVHSAEYGYTITYDESRFEKARVRLDGDTYMDRYNAKSSPYSNFLGFTPISEEVDLNEVLEAFQSDGSYAFDTGESAIGKKGYVATRISYTDNEGETPVEVTYYYMIDRKILVTVSCDADHKKELAKMLASLLLDN